MSEPQDNRSDQLRGTTTGTDTGTHDAGMRDTGMRDTGMRDTGMRDTGMRDTGGTGTAEGAAHYVPRPTPGYDDAGGSARYEEERPSGAAFGLTLMAAAFMMVSGLLGFFEGLAAVIKGSFFVVLPNYAFSWSAHAWGWTHIIIGAVVFLVGAALLTGKTWARMLGVVICAISIIANFVFLPYQPVWAVVVIALNAFVIWALLSPRNPLRA